MLLKNYKIFLNRLRNQGAAITALWLFSRGFSWITGIPILRHSRVTPTLYVGPQFNGCGMRYLKRENIHAVINMRQEFNDADHGLVLEEYCYLPTNDDDAPSMEHIQQGIAFIRRLEGLGKKVYIHCGGGIGRAPTMAAAYLIASGYSTADAIALIKKVRPFINITPPQMERLKECQVLFHDGIF